FHSLRKPLRPQARFEDLATELHEAPAGPFRAQVGCKAQHADAMNLGPYETRELRGVPGADFPGLLSLADRLLQDPERSRPGRTRSGRPLVRPTKHHFVIRRMPGGKP